MKRARWGILAAIIPVLLLAGHQQTLSLADSGFTKQSFKGRYAVGFSGTDLNVGPIAGTGIMVSDGNGNLTGTQTIKDGPFVCTESFSGTYSINADGTGAGTVMVTSTPDLGVCLASVGNVITFSLVLSGNGAGSQVKLSETNPNYVILATGDRQ